MNKSNSGFILLEAVLTVVIVSICLTFIAQALLTNFRTGMRFQETVRALIVMENELGALYAMQWPIDQLDNNAQSLGKPYDKFSFSAEKQNVEDHLRMVHLKLRWPLPKPNRYFELITFMYNPDEK